MKKARVALTEKKEDSELFKRKLVERASNLRSYCQKRDAFFTKVNSDNTDANEKSKELGLIGKLYLQRLRKCLLDGFHMFFIPELMPTYDPLRFIIPRDEADQNRNKPHPRFLNLA